MKLDEYAQLVFDYMTNKLPNVNPAILYEITEFFVMKSNNYTCDMIAENYKIWEKELDKRDKQWGALLKQMEEQRV